MLLARFICSLIPLSMGIVLAWIARNALSSGSVKPFPMGRWTEPDAVDRSDAPFTFWFWVMAYLAGSFILLILSILGAVGKLKLR